MANSGATDIVSPSPAAFNQAVMQQAAVRQGLSADSKETKTEVKKPSEVKLTPDQIKAITDLRRNHSYIVLEDPNRSMDDKCFYNVLCSPRYEPPKEGSTLRDGLGDVLSLFDTWKNISVRNFESRWLQETAKSTPDFAKVRSFCMHILVGISSAVSGVFKEVRSDKPITPTQQVLVLEFIKFQKTYQVALEWEINKSRPTESEKALAKQRRDEHRDLLNVMQSLLVSVPLRDALSTEAEEQNRLGLLKQFIYSPQLCAEELAKGYGEPIKNTDFMQLPKQSDLSSATGKSADAVTERFVCQ